MATLRTKQQIACDGVQTVWLPGAPTLRVEMEQAVRKSMDGVVVHGTLRDVATYMHRTDLIRAARAPHGASIRVETLKGFIATMDGVRSRRTVALGA